MATSANHPSPIRSAEEIWRKYDDMEQRLTAPVSERMCDLAGLRPGMRVLDLATGRGEPAIRAAHRVGPTGFVLGVDSAEAMLQMARERATRECLTNLELRAINAESLEGVAEKDFEFVLARWCLMYFTSPIAALVSARGALIPGGKLVAAVWAEPERVSYFTVPRLALNKLTSLPPINFDVPGTFRYADKDRLRRDIASAGYTVHHIEEMETDVMEAKTGIELIEWTRAFGMSRLLSDVPEEIQRAWEVELLKQAAPLLKDGFFRLGGVTRLVIASADE